MPIVSYVKHLMLKKNQENKQKNNKNKTPRYICFSIHLHNTLWLKLFTSSQTQHSTVCLPALIWPGK